VHGASLNIKVDVTTNIVNWNVSYSKGWFRTGTLYKGSFEFDILKAAQESSGERGGKFHSPLLSGFFVDNTSLNF